MKKIRVLVVDDSAFMRRVISDIINSQPDMEAVGTARNGAEALVRIREHKPDVVTLDVEMPVVDGISALKNIMETDPLPVLMLSSLTQNGAELTLQALQLGAVDFITKPSGTISLDINKVGEEITRKIRVAASTHPQLRRAFPAKRMTDARSGFSQAVSMRQPPGSLHLDKLILLGTSTGGPRALHEVIPRLPAGLNAGILIVQHMPPGFTRSLAERLDTISAIMVKEAEHGEPVLPGFAYVAPGDYHLTVQGDGRQGHNRLQINLTKAPPVSGHRPSVDVMFESVAALDFAGQIVGVILTGMGQDGSRGVVAIKKKGARVIAEDASTCIVFGMPKMAIETGSVDKVVPLPDVAQEIVKML